MATINDNGLLLNNSRVFLRSENINVFPCSRRGQEHLVTDLATEVIGYYDPEARLNTERTNRLHTALNGFKSSFIVTENFTANDTLVFVIAGYHVEAKNFDPAAIASAFGSEDTAMIYAHLRLHTNVSLGVDSYFTEMLSRQSNSEKDKNYLDVSYVDGARSGDFFVGISFTNELVDDDDPAVYNLPLFSYDSEWELVQTSLLPKIDHDITQDSIKVSGDFTVTAGHVVAADTLKVNTVNSRQENGTITIESPVALNGAATLNNGLEVTVGDAIIKSNLKVEDNINVGTPATPATADNGGYIVAKKDITAEQDLIAKRDIEATEKATVKSLVVGERADTDSTDAGTITAKKEVKTPKLRVDTITSNSGSILVDDKKLLVTKSLEVLSKKAIDEADRETPAMATIDKAIIGDLVVENNDTLNGSTGKITAKEIAAEKITQSGNQVPVITIEQVSDKGVTPEIWQLQITNVIKKPKN